jgi:putative transposase
VSTARRRYREALKKETGQGRKPELVGGGLLRSAGGWSAVKALRKDGMFLKSDERILGDSDFVGTVLADARESMHGKYALAAAGVGFEQVVQAVAGLLSVKARDIVGPGKQRTIVRARMLVCCWAVRELGLSMTEVAERLGISVPTVSVAVSKGRRLIDAEGWGPNCRFQSHNPANNRPFHYSYLLYGLNPFNFKSSC